EHVLGLAEALATVAAEARAEVQRREDLWRPVAVAIAEWLPVARRAARARSGLADVRQAEAWWKSMSDVERNERFEPIATRAMTTWEALRLQSNVNLDAVVLEGT